MWPGAISLLTPLRACLHPSSLCLALLADPFTLMTHPQAPTVEAVEAVEAEDGAGSVKQDFRESQTFMLVQVTAANRDTHEMLCVIQALPSPT